MAWQATTATSILSGSASLATHAQEAVNLFAIPSTWFITRYTVTYCVSAGAGTVPYDGYSSGQFHLFPQWMIGLQWVPTGDSPIDTYSDPDGATMLGVDYFQPWTDRNTINTAGTPAYLDSYIWAGKMEGRLHYSTGAGGSVYWSVANREGVTVETGWNCLIRVAYSQIN